MCRQRGREPGAPPGERAPARPAIAVGRGLALGRSLRLFVASSLERDGLELERLDVTDWPLARPGVLPGGDVAEVLVVAGRLAVLGLIFDPEVGAARLATLEGVEAEELA